MIKFSKLFNIPTEPEASEFKDPIFLIGLMRSGTTLLMNTLSEHPQLLKVGFELNPIWTKIGGAPCSINCAQRTEDDLKPEYLNNMTSYYTSYIEKSKGILRHLARWSAKRYYGSGSVFYDWENLYIMNKSPHLSNKIRYIHAMYPNAKFIVIVRSPYGQCASLKMHFQRHNKAENYYFELPENDTACWTNYKDPKQEEISGKRVYPGDFNLIPEAWLRLHKVIFDHLKVIEEKNKIVLSYENLVSKPDESLGKIFQFLNLDPKHDKVIDKIITKERKIHNTNTKGDPLLKWKNHLDQNELELVKSMIDNNTEIIQQIANQVELNIN